MILRYDAVGLGAGGGGGGSSRGARSNPLKNSHVEAPVHDCLGEAISRLLGDEYSSEPFALSVSQPIT